MEPLVLTSLQNGILTLTLSNPSRLNALSQPMAAALYEELEKARYRTDVRVILLRGAGGTFCAGGDVKSMKNRVDCYREGQLPETDTRQNMWNLNRLVLSVREIRKPVIAWIEGACAGGGLSLAMACDFSVAEESCKMVFAFSGIGLAPDMGSSLIALNRLGPARATDLFMTGRRFTAAQAATWGLITQAVPAEQLENTVTRLASRLAAGPSLAYGEIKASVNRICYSGLYTAMSLEADCADRLVRSRDHGEAVDAFLEKRKPVFTGQ